MERAHRINQYNDLQRFIEELEHRPSVLSTWDETLWLQLIDTVTARRDGTLVFHFKIGKDIPVSSALYSIVHSESVS